MTAGVLIAVTTAACAPARSRGNEEVPPQLTFEKLVYRVYRGAVLTADGTAERATFRRDTADVTAQGVHVRIPATDGREEARVFATSGSGNLHARRFSAKGGVRAEQGGEVAVTEEARYSAEDGLVRGDRPIVVRGDRFTMQGPDFTLDPRSQVLRIEDGARAVSGDAGK